MKQQIGDYLVRDWDMADAASLAKYANDREIWRNLTDAFPHPYGFEDAAVFIAAVSTADPVTVFAIANQEEAIGSIGLSLQPDVYRVGCELGYWLARPFRGRGIVTRAIEVMVDHAFSELDCRRIFARPYAPNAASIRVLEKAGFEHEGVHRQAVIKDGQVLDQVMLARIRA